MCGIAGIWGTTALEEPERLARVLGDALAHRGPDGEGFLLIPVERGQPRVATTRSEVLVAGAVEGLFVHRRLSIIDLASGDQPMQLEGGASWIVFNGEIYNFRELRSELEHRTGVRFCTESDTEVILAAYRAWGVPGFARLNGIFAFAIYDATCRELVLARDPLGVKPLYWTTRRNAIAFASEIRPLVMSGMADQAPDKLSMAQFLFYRFAPAPHTLWSAVRKVVPGHALRIAWGGQVREEVDFAGPAPSPASSPAEGWGSEATSRFLQAVRRQMVADVPVAAFLSGGLDSSLVAAGMGHVTEAFATFAIGFPAADGLESELAAAQRAARVLGTRHVDRELNASDYFDRLPDALAQVEEPVAHPGALLQAELAELAGRNVKVVLTGQGADEPLGGYQRHYAGRVLRGLAPFFGGLARTSVVKRLCLRSEGLARARNVVAATGDEEGGLRLFSPFAPKEAAAMVKGCDPAEGAELIRSSFRRWWNRAEGMDPTARTLYADVRLSLAEDLLLVADKTGMASSLEVRVPFLDLEYLRFLESIPGRQRVRLLGSRKRLQHAIARNILPATLTRRLASSTSPFRRKRGFDVPVNAWFRAALGPRLRDFILGPGSHIPDFIESAPVGRIVDVYLSGAGHGYRTVLALFVLELCLRRMASGTIQPSSRTKRRAPAVRGGGTR